MAKDFNVILGEAQQIKNEIIEGANTALRTGTCLEDIVQRAEVDEAAAAKNTTEIVAGDGLTGGGTIAQSRTLSVGATDDSVVVGADGIKVDTQDNLTSTSATKPLSANQGKVLNEKVVQVETDLNYSMSKKIDKIVGKNLLNSNDPEIILGKFLQGGSISNNELYSISGYIDVIGIDNITINFSLLGAYIVFYDKYKNYISFFGSGRTFSVPPTAAYVRVSGPSLDQSIWQVESGINSTAFEVYTDYKPMRDLYSSVDNKVEKVIGKNLFDKNSDGVKLGYYLYNSGALLSNAEYIVSDYIEVEPNTAYVHSNLALGGAYCCIYDSDMVIISSFDSVSITTPANARYIRLSVFKQRVDIAQFELGSVATEFSPYTELGFMEKVLDQVPTRGVECILPSKMYFIKGKQNCIYYENILLKNLEDPTSVYFNKGINYGRQVTFEFLSSAVNQSLITQISRNLKKGQRKIIEYNVIDPSINSGKIINALHIGDSFTDIGTWVKETKVLMEEQGVTYNLIGTCGNSTFRAEGLSGGTLANTFLNSSIGVGRKVTVTGMTTLPSTVWPGQIYRDTNGKDWNVRSGKIDVSGHGHVVVTKDNATEFDFNTFPASGYLTKISNGEGDPVISYSNPAPCYHNPFINPSTGLIDIANYITTWGFSNPDIVLFQFTWNDLGIWAFDYTINNLVSQFKSAVDHVHAAYPNAKIVISIEPFGSINGNADWNGKKYSVLRFAELMFLQFENDNYYNTWVKIAPAYAFVDLVYGYSSAVKTPCNRYIDVKEQSGGDGVHPSTGMYQIADCIAPILSYMI